MELCEHIQPYYQREIAAGNEVLSVSLCEGGNAEYAVFLKEAFKYEYKLALDKTINPSYSTFISPHSPESQDLFCNFCKIGLSAPLTNNQKYTYAPNSSTPNPNIIADKYNVVVIKDLSGGSMPTVRYR
jgi:hypothetical protein